MGICTCKNKTILFCFVHKKAVCENCIITQHPTCVVKTYVEWLTDSEYEPPKCGVCKGELKTDNVLRLMCFDLFHPECLDVYAKSLPAHTAKAGFGCPECKKPIFFEEENRNNNLTQQLSKYLQTASWASLFNSTTSNNLSDLQPKISNSLPTLRVTQTPNQLATTESATTKKEFAIQVNNLEDDEDKYKKKGVDQLFVALGLVQPASKTGSKGKPVRVRLNQKRILIGIALLLTVITVIILGMSTSSSAPLEDEMLPNK